MVFLERIDMPSGTELRLVILTIRHDITPKMATIWTFYLHQFKSKHNSDKYLKIVLFDLVYALVHSNRAIWFSTW